MVSTFSWNAYFKLVTLLHNLLIFSLNVREDAHTYIQVDAVQTMKNETNLNHTKAQRNLFCVNEFVSNKTIPCVFHNLCEWIKSQRRIKWHLLNEMRHSDYALCAAVAVAANATSECFQHNHQETLRNICHIIVDWKNTNMHGHCVKKKRNSNKKQRLLRRFLSLSLIKI